MLLINLHHLYYFWIVAREGGVTKACKKLFLAQPTVSTQIIQLEKFLDKKLFERKKKRLILTEDGRVVLDYANEIFGYTQELLDTLKHRPTRETVTLHLGIDTDVSKQIVTGLLKAAYRYKPTAHVIIREGEAKDLLEQLRTHALDLVLTEQGRTLPDEEPYVKAAVGRLPIFFVAAPRLARQVKSFPKDLSKIPLVLPDSASPLWGSVEQFLSQQHVRAPIIAEIQDAELMRLCALEGLGAAPLHELSVTADLKSGRLVRLSRGPSGFTKTLWLITKKRHRQNPIVQHLMAHFHLDSNP